MGTRAQGDSLPGGGRGHADRALPPVPTPVVGLSGRPQQGPKLSLTPTSRRGRGAGSRFHNPLLKKGVVDLGPSAIAGAKIDMGLVVLGFIGSQPPLQVAAFEPSARA